MCGGESSKYNETLFECVTLWRGSITEDESLAEPSTTQRHVPKKRTFAELELVEDGCLSCSIETDHENSHLFLSELEKGEKGLERRGGGEPKNQNLQNLAENVFSNRIVRKESVNQLPAMLRKRVNLNICVTRPE